MDLVPIAGIAPTLPAPDSKAIKAIVTLLWPYSSSTRRCAFLLAEPDFRLRRSRGQVRVQITGPSAQAVAKSGIGIGDEVTLGLRGAQWIKDEGALKTPGRSVDWELLFRGRLVLQVNRNAQKLADLDVDAPTTPDEDIRPTIPTSTLRFDSPEPAASPSPKAVPGTPATWSSPAFLKRVRLPAGSFMDSPYDPFEEADGYVEGKGRKKRKKSYMGVVKWTYSEKPTSQEKEDQDTGSDEEARSISPVKPADVATLPFPGPEPPSQTEEAQKPTPQEDLAADQSGNTWDQSMQQASLQARMFGGDTQENTEYNDSQAPLDRELFGSNPDSTAEDNGLGTQGTSENKPRNIADGEERGEVQYPELPQMSEETTLPEATELDMPPPAIPGLALPSTSTTSEALGFRDAQQSIDRGNCTEELSTPVLIPVPFAQLPFPSPFPDGGDPRVSYLYQASDKGVDDENRDSAQSLVQRTPDNLELTNREIKEQILVGTGPLGHSEVPDVALGDRGGPDQRIEAIEGDEQSSEEPAGDERDKYGDQVLEEFDSEPDEEEPDRDPSATVRRPWLPQRSAQMQQWGPQVVDLLSDDENDAGEKPSPVDQDSEAIKSDSDIERDNDMRASGRYEEDFSDDDEGEDENMFHSLRRTSTLERDDVRYSSPEDQDDDDTGVEYGDDDLAAAVPNEMDMFPQSSLEESDDGSDEGRESAEAIGDDEDENENGDVRQRSQQVDAQGSSKYDPIGLDGAMFSRQETTHFQESGLEDSLRDEGASDPPKARPVDHEEQVPGLLHAVAATEMMPDFSTTDPDDSSWEPGYLTDADDEVDDATKVADDNPEVQEASGMMTERSMGVKSGMLDALHSIPPNEPCVIGDVDGPLAGDSFAGTLPLNCVETSIDVEHEVSRMLPLKGPEMSRTAYSTGVDEGGSPVLFDVQNGSTNEAEPTGVNLPDLQYGPQQELLQEPITVDDANEGLTVREPLMPDSSKKISERDASRGTNSADLTEPTSPRAAFQTEARSRAGAVDIEELEEPGAHGRDVVRNREVDDAELVTMETAEENVVRGSTIAEASPREPIDLQHIKSDGVIKEHEFEDHVDGARLAESQDESLRNEHEELERQEHLHGLLEVSPEVVATTSSSPLTEQTADPSLSTLQLYPELPLDVDADQRASTPRQEISDLPPLTHVGDAQPPQKRIDVHQPPHVTLDANQQPQLRPLLSSPPMQATEQQQQFVENAPLTPRKAQRTSNAVTQEQQLSPGESEKKERPWQRSSERGARVSDVPKVLSSWFSSRRSSQLVPAGTESDPDSDSEHECDEQISTRDRNAGRVQEAVKPPSNGAAMSTAITARYDILPSLKPDHFQLPHSILRTVTPPPPPPTRPCQYSGLTTSLSYFTPLCHLFTYLNAATPLTVDVLAVVASAPTAPARAKAGPRDYFTVFYVADPSLHTNVPRPTENHNADEVDVDSAERKTPEPEPRSSTTGDGNGDGNGNGSGVGRVRVQIFRPWKASLPTAAVGDAVLLRNFAVKSRHHEPFLLSAESSAWCVWRYNSTHDNGDAREGSAGGGHGGAQGPKPVSARKASGECKGTAGRAVEECKGPPVEVGESERERIAALRRWWEVDGQRDAGVEDAERAVHGAE
ncbi:hypothetical protein BJ546DRAFT_1085586 [Cryomyces antarcticus]